MNSNNIFFEAFKTTHGAIPFDHIATSDFEPAIRRGIEEQNQEIEAIVNNQEPPTFENTIVALENSGDMLGRTLGVFYALLSAHAHDDLIEVSNTLAPLLSKHSNSITLNEQLWTRVKHVKDNFVPQEHDQEDEMLLQLTFDSFVRNGASLQGEHREKYRELTLQLTELTLKFEQNALKDNSKFELWLNHDDLEGLPDSAIEAAALAAKEKGKEGQYLVTLKFPSYVPFMKYSARRDLREQLYRAYNSQCFHGENSNINIIKDIANTRLAIAQLLGYETYAHYHLKKMMAQEPSKVFEMLNRLKTAYEPAFQQEMQSLEAYATKLEGKAMKIMPWDYSYYANKEKDELYKINDELLRPYFELSHVTQGIFGLATRLYGITFKENHDAQVFHHDMKAFDVADRDGSFLGMLYVDFFPRLTKQSGAWMTDFREQHHDQQDNDVRPLVSITMNFTKPTESKPSLLTFGEVRTFAHEFGHALHSLLSQCRYASLSGTNVYRDFVEMPSQFNENFLLEREFLDSFATHYLTGEKIPQEYIDRIVASAQYGAAYACMRQLGFGFIDMAWYTLTAAFNGNPQELEYEALKQAQLFEPVEGCMMSTQFGHIFSGGYAAGYYGYKWAEVLDADAFAKFKQEGVFNSQTAQSLRDNILSRGGTNAPMKLYTNFMGREPQIDALLKRDGIKTQK